jgi:hypothetical protein
MIFREALITFLVLEPTGPVPAIVYDAEPVTSDIITTWFPEIHFNVIVCISVASGVYHEVFLLKLWIPFLFAITTAHARLILTSLFVLS